ncbi:Heat shock transcription factor family [Phytophthora cactorum]|nr:Heat shock transcription factor family [Phytophthora cactorum]
MTSVEKLVTESAHAGTRLRPLAKAEVVELPLEAGELAMLEILRKNFTLKSGYVEDLEVGTVDRPREDAGLFVVQDIRHKLRHVPRFVRAVYDMLQNEDQRILSWSADGSRFQVYDVPRLETEVLRKYFKHDKFSSFQRQLNNFGFHKWTKTRASVATFSHDMLVRCHPSQLSALVSQMKLKQKAVTTTTATPHTALVKKPKMSPRDVCAVHELSGMSFASILEPLWLLEDDICSSEDDLLLLDALDSISQTLSDCEMEALLGGAFDVNVGTNDIDVDALLFV